MERESNRALESLLEDTKVLGQAEKKQSIIRSMQKSPESKETRVMTCLK